MPTQQYVVPWINYETLRERATEFRRRFSADEIVCPIEHIVEFGLGLDIVPVPDLHRNIETSGYLSQDRSAIVVDEYCLHSLEATYRYTLAHEVAHLELHSELWEHLRFENALQWREAILSVLTDEQYTAVEWQANAFAGLILVPGDHLRTVFEDEAGQVTELGQRYQGVDQQTCFDVCLQVLCKKMAGHFVVHPVTVGVRCDYDGLSNEFADRLLGPSHGVKTSRRLLARQ